MKKIKVSRQKNFKQDANKFSPEALANRLLLQSGLVEGTKARVKFKAGKLIIRMGKKLKYLNE